MNTIETQIFKNELLAQFANFAKDNGMQVYWTKWQHTTEKPTYFHFTDGVNIGYCQLDYFGGVKFSTIHKPCKECGTGFGLNKNGIYEPKIDDFKGAFIVAPNWANCLDVKAVKKYRDWHEYTTTGLNKTTNYIEY